MNFTPKFGARAYAHWNQVFPTDQHHLSILRSGKATFFKATHILSQEHVLITRYSIPSQSKVNLDKRIETLYFAHKKRLIKTNDMFLGEELDEDRRKVYEFP